MIDGVGLHFACNEISKTPSNTGKSKNPVWLANG
jgi:hypothetical protein